MIRHHATAAAALVVSTLFAWTAAAQSVGSLRAAAPAALVEHAALHPAPGRVPLRIDVTQPRRVMLRRPAARGLEYVCTTPCRVYVAPGAVDVVLVGWTANAYHWEVPTRGGAVHLLARRPDGRLTPMPSAEPSRSAVLASR